MPAIAVADALRAEGAEVTFVGGERAEAELVPAAGYPLDRIAVEGISRSNPLKAARALLKAAGALGGARRILRARRPDAVLGGGGYVAGPVGLAAALEADPARAHGGRLAPRADQPRAGLARPPRLPRLPARGPRRRPLPGHGPARPADRTPTAPAPAPSSASARTRPCVLVFGGSLGARSINLAAVEGLAGAPYRVLHVAGRRDFAELTAPDDALRPARLPQPVRRGARRRRPRRRPLGRLGVRARPVRAAGRADPVPARLGRPPEHQRALDGRRRRGGRHRATRSSPRSACAREVDAIALDAGRLRAMSAASARAGPARRRPRHRGRGARGGARKLSLNPPIPAAPRRRGRSPEPIGRDPGGSPHECAADGLWLGPRRRVARGSSMDPS